LVDPTNNNSAYDLASDATKFGSLRLYVAYQNMDGLTTGVTEFTAANNGDNGYVAANSGTNIGANVYEKTIDVKSLTARGTGRIVSIGQIKELALDVKTRLPIDGTTTVSTLVQNTYADFVISGTTAMPARRQVVSNEKCNVCHGALGATSGANTLANAFHGGARSTVEACVVCHDVNKVSASTFMTNGSGFNESYQFKRMIHGIHGNSKRTYPFTHGNPILGSFSKTGELLLADGKFPTDYTIRGFTPVGTPTPPVVPAETVVPMGSTFQTIADIINTAAQTLDYTGSPVVIENYAAEVAYPGVGLNCNACHVNDSYKQDLSPLGSVVKKDVGVTDPNGWKVISPKVATCTACHDSAKAIEHVTLNIGDPGAVFGTQTQADLVGLPKETCNDCHAPGARKAVDLVHGQK
jgi:cytochrome c553